MTWHRGPFAIPGTGRVIEADTAHREGPRLGLFHLVVSESIAPDAAGQRSPKELRMMRGSARARPDRLGKSGFDRKTKPLH